VKPGDLIDLEGQADPLQDPAFAPRRGSDGSASHREGASREGASRTDSSSPRVPVRSTGEIASLRKHETDEERSLSIAEGRPSSGEGGTAARGGPGGSPPPGSSAGEGDGERGGEADPDASGPAVPLPNHVGTAHHTRMSEPRKRRIERLARREWYVRLALWLAGGLLTVLAWAVTVATAGLVRPRYGPRSPPGAGAGDGDGDGDAFRDSPAGRALAESKARLELLGQRKAALLRLKGEIREHARTRWALRLPGARRRGAERLDGRMSSLAAELATECAARGADPAVARDASAWEGLGARATEESAQAAIDLVNEAVARELALKAERDAAYAAEQVPLWEAEREKVAVQRAGVEMAAEAQAAALEAAGGGRRGAGGRRVPAAERRRLREGLRAKMEVIRGLDRREDRVARELNRLGLSAASAEMRAEDRRRQMRALLVGVWSASMWAMWARPLVAETWLAVDKGFLKRMRDGRDARRKRREDARAGKVHPHAGHGRHNLNTDTAMTAWAGFKGIFGLR